MKFTLASILAVASLSVVNAQGGGGITPCIIQCSQEASGPSGCNGINDLECVCTSSTFQNAATACLVANCTEMEQEMAVRLQEGLCAGQSASGSLSTTISAPSGSASIDAGVISSLSQSLGGVTSAPTASGTGAVSGASASAGSATSAAGSAISNASGSVSGAIDSATSAISSVTDAGNGASKVDLNIKWGVVGAGAVGMAVGALAVF